MQQPLNGLKVLDFTTLLPGPLATLMLSEAGAQVLKIERPQGEDARFFPPNWEGQSAFFALLNAGKDSLPVDLKAGDVMDILTPLIEEADILVEQFRPGVMDRLGLGYEACRVLNPRLIYCSISGYGARGPKAGAAGHDINYIGDTGLLSLSPGALKNPTVPPALIADIGGGSMPAVINILLAVLQRQRTGEGCYLDIAMCDAMFMFSFWAAGMVNVGAGAPKPGGELLSGGSPRYQLYPTSDGRLVACGALEQKFWINLCTLIGLPEELRNDAADPQKTIAAVRALIAQKPAAYWRQKFAGQDCCCSVVATMEEALADRHFVERGLFAHRIASGTGVTMPALSVPIAPAFRGDAKDGKSAPGVGGASGPARRERSDAS